MAGLRTLPFLDAGMLESPRPGTKVIFRPGTGSLIGLWFSAPISAKELHSISVTWLCCFDDACTEKQISRWSMYCCKSPTCFPHAKHWMSSSLFWSSCRCRRRFEASLRESVQQPGHFIRFGSDASSLKCCIIIIWFVCSSTVTKIVNCFQVILKLETRHYNKILLYLMLSDETSCIDTDSIFLMFAIYQEYSFMMRCSKSFISWYFVHSATI